MADPHDPQNDFRFSCFRQAGGIISTLLAGENVLAVMPTGSGKSLCYQVPALAFGGLSVVVAFGGAMLDQVAALQLQGVAAETINSSRDREANVAVMAAGGRRRCPAALPFTGTTDDRADAGRVAAPAYQPHRRDEAHCISQWGPSFRPEYETLSSLRDKFPVFPSARSPPRRTR
jgi:ATP-dependent DNA helicase RecQ